MTTPVEIRINRAQLITALDTFLDALERLETKGMRKQVIDAVMKIEASLCNLTGAEKASVLLFAGLHFGGLDMQRSELEALMRQAMQREP